MHWYPYLAFTLHYFPTVNIKKSAPLPSVQSPPKNSTIITTSSAQHISPALSNLMLTVFKWKPTYLSPLFQNRILTFNKLVSLPLYLWYNLVNKPHHLLIYWYSSNLDKNYDNFHLHANRHHHTASFSPTSLCISILHHSTNPSNSTPCNNHLDDVEPPSVCTLSHNCNFSNKLIFPTSNNYTKPSNTSIHN